MAITDVILSRRGGVNPVPLQLNNIRAGWEINTAGTFSGSVPISFLETANLPLTDLRGYWLEWVHPSLGTWNGIITSSSINHFGVMEIGAETHHIQLRKIFQAAAGGTRQELPQRYPGQYMQWILQDAASVSQTAGTQLYLTAGSIEQGHAPVLLNVMLADYYEEIIPAITTDIDYEWDVTPDRRVNYGRRMGSDKRGSVRIAEGMEIAAVTLENQLMDITNAITGIGTYYTYQKTRVKPRTKNKEAKFLESKVWSNPYGKAIPHGPSVQKYGVLAEVIDYGYVGSNQYVIDTFVTTQLQFSTNPPMSLVLDTVEIGDYWSRIRNGDVIRVVLGSVGVETDFRILSRAYDSTSGILVLSGEAYLSGYQLLPNVFIPQPVVPGDEHNEIGGGKRKKKKKDRKKKNTNRPKKRNVNNKPKPKGKR